MILSSLGSAVPMSTLNRYDATSLSPTKYIVFLTISNGSVLRVYGACVTPVALISM